MFKLDGPLKFITVETNYIKALFDACPEVYYKPNHYDNKPYIGILVNGNSFDYIIPLSSAKEKHKNWKNSYSDRMLIFEKELKSNLSENDIFIDWINEPTYAKHILSVIDIKKMIPVKKSAISIIDINSANSDSDVEKKYKDLLTKEYKFCVKNIDKIISRATKIYDNQKEKGIVLKYGCDYSILEQVCASYFENA